MDNMTAKMSAFTRAYFEDYNAKNPKHNMQAPEGVGYILAVRGK